jgi:hypothetical protein
MKTEFLFREPLESTTAARDIFKVVSDIFEEHGIECKNLYAVYTNGPLPCWVTDPDFKL